VLGVWQGECGEGGNSNKKSEELQTSKKAREKGGSALAP